MIESGKKGRLPSKIGEHQTLKKIYNNREIQEGKAIYTKSVPRPKLTHKISANRAQERNYQGPAIRSETGNAIHGKYEPSGKQNFRGDGLGRNLVEETKGHNVNRESIQQYATNRDSTSHNIMGSAGKSQVTYSNLQDKARNTIKQTTLHSREGNTKPVNEKSTYSSLQDNAKQTIKQTTLYSREGNTNPVNQKSTYSNLQDEAKPTIKQSTLYSRDGNTKPVYEQSTYSNLTDEAKPTIKHSTLYSRDGNTKPVYEQSTYSNLTDEAKPTIKHSTLYSREGQLKSALNHSTYKELTDKAKQTIKETTLTSKEFHMRGNDESYVRDKNFKAKPTIKQTTLFATPEINPTRPGQSSDRQIIMDKARPTIKETTLLEGHTNPLGNVEKKPRVFDNALNMQINDCKEESLKTRPNPGGEQKYRKYYNSESDTRKKLFNNSARVPNISRPLDYQTPDSNNTYHTRIKDSTVTDNYRITDDYINTLKDNPLVNDLRHQKNTNYTL